MSDSKVFYIYCHTSPNGKRYVGQTCLDLELRWKNGRGYDNCTLMHRAIEKYGWENFRHEILCIVHSREVADLFEKHYITKFDTHNPERGYNLTDGGAGVVGCKWDEDRKQRRSEMISGEGNPMYGRHHSEEVRKKMSENRKGKPVSPEMREFRTNILLEANRKRRTPVRQIDLDGNVVATYDGFGVLVSETGFNHANIIGVCQGKRDYAYGYRWEYVDEDLRKKAEDVRKERSRSGLAVIQLDMDGNEVARFPSLTEIHRVTGLNRNKIAACCHGKRDAYAGYQWTFEGKSQNDSNGLAVIQMSPDGTEIARFDSISEASASTGVTQMRIRQCCKGIQNTASGYVWKFTEGGVETPRHDGSKKCVIQLDMNGNELARFQSLSELERLGFNRHTVSDCCKGIRDSYRDYKWRFAEQAA